MNSIEITTTHNVTIRYEIASLGFRGLALLIDSVIIGLACALFFWVFAGIIKLSPAMVGYYVLAPIFFFYSLLFEVFNNGRSPGKMMVKIRVIRIDGQPVQFLDYLMRWVFRSVDIWGAVGTIGLLGIMSSTKNQRLGDYLGNTVVVQIKNEQKVSLANLESLMKTADFTPTYTGILQMSEDEMVLIKKVITRATTINNKAHKMALTLTAQKLADRLEVPKPKNDLKFLKSALKDYVVLTR